MSSLKGIVNCRGFLTIIMYRNLQAHQCLLLKQLKPRLNPTLTFQIITELSTMNFGSSQQLELQGSVQSDEIEAKVTALNVTADTSDFDDVLSPNTDNGSDDSSHLSLFLASESHTKIDNSAEIANAENFKAEQTADVSLERAWAQAKASKGHSL